MKSTATAGDSRWNWNKWSHRPGTLRLPIDCFRSARRVVLVIIWYGNVVSTIVDNGAEE